MEGKNIAFLINDITAVGGTERITVSLANCFSVNGNKVTIYSCNKSNEVPQFEVSPQIEIYHLNSKLKTSNGIKPLKYISYIQPLKLLLNSYTPDFLLCQSLPMAIIGYFSTNLTKTKLIACEHTSYDYYSYPIRILSNHFYNLTDALVLINKSDFRTRMNGKVRNPVYIPNMVSLVHSDSSPSHENNCIVAVGRLEHHKGFDRLIAAMPKVLHKYPNWKLRIYGTGSEYHNLNKQISKLNLSSNIFLEGVETNPDKIYKGASFIVVPSRIEGFGLVLIEASAYYLPIISFDCPSGPRDILEHGKGILVEDGNVEALSDSIINLIHNKATWVELKNRSGSILAQYSPSRIYPLWHKLFMSLSAKGY